MGLLFLRVAITITLSFESRGNGHALYTLYIPRNSADCVISAADSREIECSSWREIRANRLWLEFIAGAFLSRPAIVNYPVI